MYIYICIYTYIYIHIHLYIYIYIYNHVIYPTKIDGDLDKKTIFDVFPETMLVFSLPMSHAIHV